MIPILIILLIVLLSALIYRSIIDIPNMNTPWGMQIQREKKKKEKSICKIIVFGCLFLGFIIVLIPSILLIIDMFMRNIPFDFFITSISILLLFGAFSSFCLIILEIIIYKKSKK